MAPTNHPPRPARRLAQLLLEERADVALIVLYAAMAGVLALSVPLGVQAIIGLVAGGLFLQPVVVLIGFVIVGAFASGGAQLLQLAVVERVQQRVFARYALEMAQRVPRARVESLGDTDLPELTNRFFEIVGIQKSLSKLLSESIGAVLTILASLMLLTFYHPYFSLFGGALVALLAVTLWMTGKRGLQTSLDESTSKYRVAHWLQELARQSSLFRRGDAATLAMQRMDAEVDTYLTHRRAHFRVIVRQSISMLLMKTSIIGVLLIVGAALVIDRRITLGQFVASELVIVMVVAGVEKLILALATVYDLLVAVEKAAHLRDIPVHADAGGSPLPAARTRGAAVRIRNLRFRYSGQERDTLDDISVSIRPGSRVAIVATEGSGASTLLRIFERDLVGYSGAVTVDGVSLRDLAPEAHDAAIALVDPSQKPFAGTIDENVSIGRNLNSDQVRAALSFVGLARFIDSLPQGLRTPVAQISSTRFTSHVVRKLLLARAVATRPRVLLFDEFFHHLKPQYKRRMLRRLARRRNGWTIIAASHDPHYVALCDQVIILINGKIIKQGDYAECRDTLVAHGLLRQTENASAAGRPAEIDA